MPASVPGMHEFDALAPARRRMVERLVMAAFGGLSLFWAWAFVTQGAIGHDAPIYVRAASLFLQGGDPWTAENGGFHYAGSPQLTIALSPLALVPEPAAVAVLIALAAVSSYVIVVRSRLPLWWLAYPPLIHGILSGNPGALVVALLLTRHAWAAPLVKVVGGIPLVAELRWRALLIAAAVTGVTVVLAPGLWTTYLTSFTVIGDRLVRESTDAFAATGWLVIPTAAALGALALIDRRAAGWLVVPAIWPATQYHYAAFFLPISPAAAVIAAVPGLKSFAIAAIAYATVRVARHVRARRSATATIPTRVKPAPR
jgi:hypothetical protein